MTEQFSKQNIMDERNLRVLLILPSNRHGNKSRKLIILLKSAHLVTSAGQGLGVNACSTASHHSDDSLIL